jgi:putative oxidoreductase
MLNIGLLSLRLVVGLLLAGHGAQKLFGWFGGGGFKGTIGMMRKLGFRPAWLWALLASLSEFGGGVLLALGFLNPLGSVAISAPMLMAIVKVHWSHGIWATKGGFELPLTNLVAALTVALTGPGIYSVDAVLGLALPEPATLGAGMVLVVLGLAAAFLSEVRVQSAPTHK